MQRGRHLDSSGSGELRAFSPRHLRGCTLWLRADLVTKDGSNNVAQETDASGQGHSATQSTTANKPLWVAAGQNARPTVRGNADQARGLAVSGHSFSGAGTLCAVFSKTALTAYVVRANGGGFIENFTANLIEWYNPADRQTLKSSPATGLHIATVVQVDGVSCVGYWDGAQAFSTTPTVPLSGVFEIGNSGGLTLGTDGDISEVIAYGRALGIGELRRLHRYLGQRYSIAVP